MPSDAAGPPINRGKKQERARALFSRVPYGPVIARIACTVPGHRQ